MVFSVKLQHNLYYNNSDEDDFTFYVQKSLTIIFNKKLMFDDNTRHYEKRERETVHEETLRLDTAQGTILMRF